MALSIEVLSSSARPGPQRALQFQCRLHWQRQSAFLLGIDARVSAYNRVISDTVFLNIAASGQPATLQFDQQFVGSVVAPISGEAIRFVEERRINQDVQLVLQGQCRWQEAIAQNHQISLAGPVHWDTLSAGYSVPRSEWLKRLTEMEWSETDLFEVPVLPLSENPNLTQALRLIREASQALRSADYKGVLVKCREALESAAKYTAQSNDPQDLGEGFELLLTQAFPSEDVKASALNKLIQAFSPYLHSVGRHAQYPALQPSRSEAEFVFATTVAFFSMVSRRLAGWETA